MQFVSASLATKSSVTRSLHRAVALLRLLTSRNRIGWRLSDLADQTGLDPATVQPHLDAIVRIAAGDPTAGPIARLGQAERFHWLVAPSSTIIQVSDVHTGLCDDPATELDHLMATLVA